jgi:hypothetical protein
MACRTLPCYSDPRAPSSGLARVTVDGLQPQWRVAGLVGRALSGLRTTQVQTRLARSISRSLTTGSSLCSSRLDLKSRSRDLARVGMHRHIHPQTRESSSDDPAREVEILNRAHVSKKREQRFVRLNSGRGEERRGEERRREGR